MSSKDETSVRELRTSEDLRCKVDLARVVAYREWDEKYTMIAYEYGLSDLIPVSYDIVDKEMCEYDPKWRSPVQIVEHNLDTISTYMEK